MLLLLWQAEVCSSSEAGASGASCSKDVKDSSGEETTDDEEDSEDDEQWNSDEAERDELSICFVTLFQDKSYDFYALFRSVVAPQNCVFFSKINI